MSEEKINFYRNEIDRYKMLYEKNKTVEEKFGYSSEGYKLK